jgi:hypothetical protein
VQRGTAGEIVEDTRRHFLLETPVWALVLL